MAQQAQPCPCCGSRYVATELDEDLMDKITFDVWEKTHKFQTLASRKTKEIGVEDKQILDQLWDMAQPNGCRHPLQHAVGGTGTSSAFRSMLLEDAAPRTSHFTLGVEIAGQAPNTSTHAWATMRMHGEMGLAWSTGGG